MVARVGTVCWGLFVALLLSACGLVDHFSPRVYDANTNSDQVLNQETLLNIVRASQFQPLNFVVISQIAGQHTETLNNGLPTITLGPGQTVAQHQAVFGPNSLASAVQGSYQVNQLVSAQFQEGMLAPVTLRTMAMLLASHPREPVLYALIDSIRFKLLNTIVSYRNDPLDDRDENGNFSEQCPDKVRNSFGRTLFLNDQTCNFSKFVNFLQLFMAAGLKAELVACDSKTVGCNTAKAATSPTSVGRLCFDPTLARQELKSIVERQLGPLCGSKPSAKKDAVGSVPFASVGRVGIDGIVLRSPNGVYNFLGKLYRENAGFRIGFYTGEAKNLRGQFLDIVQAEGPANCFVSVFVDGKYYCVPQGAETTTLMITILEQLRNLATAPSDLNAAYSVRLIN